MRNRILFLVCLFGTVTLFTTNLYAQNDYKELSTWTGTGFALNKGHIVTNYHVVEDANSISVSGINGDFTKTYQATVVATDKVNDLAILKINDNRFTGFGALPYSIRWQMAEVGDDVFVLGYPLTQTMGEEIKLTNGIISSRTGFQGDASLYQMSAPIQPGNSGGPMFDSKGNVIGIVCAQHRGTENVGYAIKTSYLKNLAESFSLTNIFPTNNTVSTLTLSGQVKKLKNYVYIIQCSNSGSGILSSNIVADPNMITIRVGNVSFDMIKVKSGSFIMGCTSEQGEDCFETEKPCHRVTITKDYYIGKFEVTQELYKVVMNTNPSEYKTNEHPVENVSWYDAQMFCEELSRMTGYHFSLPTEAEWEYAARGGNKSTNAKYSGSSIVNAVAWYFFKGDFQPNSVGKLRPNELGIYDMSGNVWEWCQDWMGNYKSTNQTDPIESKESTERIIVQGTGRIIREGTERILRGGCYISEANECRVTNRGSMPPDYTNTFIGFRIVLH